MAVRLSTVFARSGGETPINSFQPYNDTRDLFTSSNGGQWLKTGVLRTDIANYPDATRSSVFNSNRSFNVSGSGLVNFPNPIITGVQREGNDIWIMVTSNVYADIVMQKYDLNFTLLREFSIQGAGKPLPDNSSFYYGLPTFAFDGTNHWVTVGSTTGFGNATPYIVNTSGGSVTNYNLYGNTFPIDGCTFDGSKIWISNGTGDETGRAQLREVNLDGTFSGETIAINTNYNGSPLVWATDRFVLETAIDGSNNANNAVNKAGTFSIWPYQGFTVGSSYFAVGSDFYVRGTNSILELYFTSETQVVGAIQRSEEYGSPVFTRIG